MTSHYGKLVSVITILLISTLILLMLDKISHKVFAFSFIPLAIVMLLLGLFELRGTYRKK